MRVRVLLIALFAIGATACSGAVTESAVTTGGTIAASPNSSSAGSPGSTEPGSPPVTEPAAAAAERVRPEGRDAPDFALALGDGGEFRLSSEAKPVYMVFWAEW